jgi:3'(2'), 5'-bisphosphate nucleotidase
MSDPVDSDTRLLEAMVAAALQAGRAIDEIYRRGFEVTHKADATPVTDADRAAEAIILEHLQRAARDVPIVAEEEVAAGRAPTVGVEFFLVDPLDGTKEFVQRRGDFTVNVALVRCGSPVLGVVYAPANSQLFAGNVPAGTAFRSEQAPTADTRASRVPIRVRPAPQAGLTVVASRSHATPETDTYLSHYTVAERVAVGSSLKFCLLAAGFADLYPRLGPTMEWDTAAGHAVLAAAGGRVLAPGGASLRYGKAGFRNPSFIASGTLEPLPLTALNVS